MKNMDKTQKRISYDVGCLMTRAYFLEDKPLLYCVGALIDSLGGYSYLNEEFMNLGIKAEIKAIESQDEKYKNSFFKHQIIKEFSSDLEVFVMSQ